MSRQSCKASASSNGCSSPPASLTYPNERTASSARHKRERRAAPAPRPPAAQPPGGLPWPRQCRARQDQIATQIARRPDTGHYDRVQKTFSALLPLLLLLIILPYIQFP